MSFTYNSDGIRTSKTVNGITTTYYLDGILMTKKHIKWEFRLHMIGYKLGFESCKDTDLNVEETPWEMFKRALGW